MKKSAIIILLALIVGQTLYSQSGLRPRGDVNCDWEVNIADINSLVDSIFNMSKYNGLYSYATDVNGDKEINIADINLLVGAILGDTLDAMPSFSGTQPVMYINTEGYRNIDSKEFYLHAHWWLDAMGIDGCESLGSPQQPLGMLIKGRGNYTWTVDKKSFRLKLDDKKPILGMASNRHFCLLAHPDDHYAKLKNTMGFELSRRIGLSWTPQQRPVEVVLNGQYIGLYFLTEKIRVDKKRVNIEEQQDMATDLNTITGGWLLEINNNRDDNTLYFNERNGGWEWYDWLWITPHSPEVLSEQQTQYLTDFITRTNAAIYNEDKTNLEWENYIDIDSLACFYIVGEILDDTEYFSGSCYMHKHRGQGTKLIFGPVWDFGNSFHRKLQTGADSFNYFLYQKPNIFYNHWIEEIAKFPHFQEILKKHWRAFYQSGFNGLDIDQFIDDHVNSIKQAWYCNAARWKGNAVEWEAYIFKQNLHRKIDWLNEQWGDNQ